jgi:hypothetical protein
MNRFTAIVWDVITDDESLLAELTAIMRKASEQCITISSAYISENRKAFFGEQPLRRKRESARYRSVGWERECINSSSRSKR